MKFFGFSAMAAGTALVLWGAGQVVGVKVRSAHPHPTSRWPGGASRIWQAPGALLRWFGRHSYELYLFHIIVIGLLRVALPSSQVAPAAKPLWLLGYLAASAAVAAAVARFYAEPMNRWLRRSKLTPAVATARAPPP